MWAAENQDKRCETEGKCKKEGDAAKTLYCTLDVRVQAVVGTTTLGHKTVKTYATLTYTPGKARIPLTELIHVHVCMYTNNHILQKAQESE